MSTTATISLSEAEDTLRRFQPKLVSPDSLNREYASLCNEERKLLQKPQEYFATGVKMQNLNRYSNIWPLEHCIFPPACRTDPSKYFNANLFDATEHGMGVKFVAHGAPVPDAIPAFWDAVYQSRAQTIVMLTRLSEGGRHKADQYWPPAEGQSWELSNGLVVTNTGPPKQRASTSTSIPPSPSKNGCASSSGAAAAAGSSGAVSGTNAQQQQQQLQMELKTPTRVGVGSATNSPPPTPGTTGGRSDNIHHTVLVIRPKGTTAEEDEDASSKTLQTVLTRYEGWPDFGVPSSTASVQQLFEDLDTRLSLTPPSPTPHVFVHCSAGVGRTGTFIGSYICRDVYRRGKFNPAEGVFNVVSWMKQRRVYSVQQPEQYVFLHKLVAAEMAALIQRLRNAPPARPGADNDE